jgi:hypothetical protein
MFGLKWQLSTLWPFRINYDRKMLYSFAIMLVTSRFFFSSVVNPWGDVIAKADSGEETVIVDIDLVWYIRVVFFLPLALCCFIKPQKVILGERSSVRGMRMVVSSQRWRAWDVSWLSLRQNSGLIEIYWHLLSRHDRPLPRYCALVLRHYFTHFPPIW